MFFTASDGIFIPWLSDQPDVVMVIISTDQTGGDMRPTCRLGMGEAAKGPKEPGAPR